MQKMNKNRAAGRLQRFARRQSGRLAVFLTAAMVANSTAPLFAVTAQASVIEGGQADAATPSDQKASPSDQTPEETGDEEQHTDESQSGNQAGAGGGSGAQEQPMTAGALAREGETIRIEAEDFYDADKCDTADDCSGGKRASLRRGTDISVALGTVTGFTDGNYLVRMKTGGQTQMLKVQAGAVASELICPENDENNGGTWSWHNREMEFLDVVPLTAGSTLTVSAVHSADSYTWIDWIELVPTEEKRVCYQAKDYASNGTGTTGDYDGTKLCANMDPGCTVAISLDNSFESGTYSLLLTTTGNERTYGIQVGGADADGYTTSGADWGVQNLHSDGFQGSYDLKAGDTITVTAPADTVGWLKDIVLKKTGESGPAGGVTVEGEKYIFEGENYYKATGDGLGADFQPHTSIEIPLANVPDFKAGNYLIQAVHAGIGQILGLEAGSVHSELICAPAGFDWGNSQTAESMDVFALTGTETIRINAVTNDKYTWIDKIILVPTAEHRIRLNVKDSAVTAEHTTGDQDSCANMDPGYKVTIRLDQRFTSGQYAMQLFTCGNAKIYTVSVNGTAGEEYQAKGNGSFGTDQMLAGGWQNRYELKAGDEVVISSEAGSGFGWIKDIVFQELPVIFYKKDAATGIIVEADEGILPAGTELAVKEMGSVGKDSFADLGLRAVGYRLTLTKDGQELDLTTDARMNQIQVTVPIPAGYDRESENLDLYYMNGDEGEPLRAAASDDGRSLIADVTANGVYAVTTDEGIYHYEAENYYHAITDNGSAANFESGNGQTITVPLRAIDGFVRGQYNLLLRYCGGGDKKIKVSAGSSSAEIPVSYTDWADYRLAPAEGVLDLHPGDELKLTVPDNQYHWADYIRLVKAEPFSDEADGVSAEAAIGSLPYGAYLSIEEAGDDDAYMQELHNRFALGSITGKYIRFRFGEEEAVVIPATAVTIRMAVPADMDAGSYCLYYVSGSGYGTKCTKIPSKLENGEIVFSITRETGMFALVEGAAYTPANYDEEAIYTRSGAKVGAGQGSASGSQPVQPVNQPVKTRSDGSTFVYEGEGYYKEQGGSLTGDLQPGAQIRIPLSDNALFRAGAYRLTIRSNGNRQKLIVKVNDIPVGNVLRPETSFDMTQMNDASLPETLYLSPSDILVIEGEDGGHYGWVDYVSLTRVETAAIAQTPGAAVTWQAVGLYAKPAEGYPAADLQPGDSLSLRVGDHAGFVPGAYRVAVSSNGNRTCLLVKLNGVPMGSIVRVTGSGFEKTDFTTNVMNHTLVLQPDDILTLEASGNAEEGPWGWVETVSLLPAPQPTGTVKPEYRYDGEDFYQASPYSPAADLQPLESIVVPVSNDPDFCAGLYRLSVLSNGTRELFHVAVNGIPVGDIRRKATGYSGIDYSQDYLDQILALKPGDVLTVTGQDGDHYGWVNYILLERAGQ